MRFIGPSQECAYLYANHSVFYEQNISAETSKAYKIKVNRVDGSLFVGWVPKSKMLILTIHNHTNPDEPVSRFFIPKFFTRCTRYTTTKQLS